MNKLNFTNKSDILEQLERLLKKGKILPQVHFTVKQYKDNPRKIISDVDCFLKDTKGIVRSSSLTEDGQKESKAGQFLSVLDVSGMKPISDAITKVIGSFDSDDENNIVFVQPMLNNVECSGVAFTLDPNNCANYYVINYDESGSTESVTSGLGTNLKTYYLYRNHDCTNNKLVPLIEAIKEIESLTNNVPLDIEFAISGKDVYIFQVRPLANKQYRTDNIHEMKILKNSENKLRNYFAPSYNIAGHTNLFSVMTDWNPAEMIGVHPRPLALSIYKRLITDREWAYQRHNYGYRDLRSFPLMIELAGHPYIDTRVSFNSFVPSKLDDEVGSKLVDYYLKCLKDSPEKHDKVEFEIVYSCYSFDIDSRLEVLNKHGFAPTEISEIKTALLDLTNHIIRSKNGLWVQDSTKVKMLETRREKVLNSDLDTVSKIYWLLEDCGRYGTLPFAGLARAGFVAVQLLDSLVNIGVLSKEEYQSFMGTLNTVSSQMENDLSNLSRTSFIKKYGHLRPGTYDITAPRYDENPDLYFKNDEHETIQSEKESFSLTLNQYSLLTDLLNTHGLEMDVLQLFNFIKNGIEGREYSKFVFTKSVSAVLELLAELGEKYGYTREDMSYFEISKINELYVSSEDIGETLSKSISEGKSKYAESGTLVLPPIITNPIDVFEFYIPSSVPNYITTKTVSGKIVFDINKRGFGDLDGNILLIEAADPGYDWIFSHKLLGFITKYGGSNSHMAIRAGELGIPAVIGVGEQLYNTLMSARTVFIDCNNKKIDLIK